MFKTYFSGMNLKEFYRNHLFWILCVTIAAVITYKICSLISGGALMKLVARGCVCAVVPNILLFIMFFKTKQFQNAKKFLDKLILMFTKRIKK